MFTSGEPVTTDKLAQALEIDKPTAVKIANFYADKRNAEAGGIKIIKVDDAYQMISREEYADYIRRAFEIKRNTPLSQAAMEVLSIIAYRQPVTKGYIEQVRGVDCSGVLNSLVSKGLVEEQGRLEVPGKPILYGTTLVFLKCFGMSSLRDLPEVEGLQPVVAEKADNN